MCNVTDADLGTHKSDQQELRQFFSWAYWIVGGMCFYWETLAIISLLRPEQEGALPLLGKCSNGEIIVFMLTFFWPVLLIAHLLVYGHQSVTHSPKYSAHFPGVLGDKALPKALSSLRVVLFLLLVFWPTVLHTVLAVRAFDHMTIALKDGHGIFDRNKDARNQPGGEKVKADYVEYGGSEILRPLKLPQKFPPNTTPDWRWLHKNDRTRSEEPPIAFILMDATGRLIPLTVEGSGKSPTLASVTAPNQAATQEPPKPSKAKEQEKEEPPIRPKHWPTAITVLQPWWFVISTAGFCASAIWLLFKPLWKTETCLGRVLKNLFRKNKKKT